MGHAHRLELRALAGALGAVAATGLVTGCGSGGGASSGGSQAPGRARSADVAADISHGAKTAKTVQTRTASALKARSNAIVTAAPTKLVVKLDEYRISPPINAVPKGPLKLTIVDRGTKRHHLLVVRTGGSFSGSAYSSTTGLVDTKVLARSDRLVGALPQVTAGGAASRTFLLKAGSYMLICGVPGHYRAGMRASLIVRGR